MNYIEEKFNYYIQLLSTYMGENFVVKELGCNKFVIENENFVNWCYNYKEDKFYLIDELGIEYDLNCVFKNETDAKIYVRNKIALHPYKKFDFKIIDEDDEVYFMKLENNKKINKKK